MRGPTYGTHAAYEWRRGRGWRRLTGENIDASGPSFGDLKGLLDDSEWLADPEAKAMKVVEGCLREFPWKGHAS